MERLHVEAATASLSKYGEELCGDRVEIERRGDLLTVVLSDGLGSGVKANILATLTTTLAASMLRGGATIEDVVDTIGHTLPICQVRKVAYSTFTILQIDGDGNAYIVEYDNPGAFYVSDGHVAPIPMEERRVGDKVVREARFTVKSGDHIFVVSDGVIYAGIGGVLNLGWRWPSVADYIERITRQDKKAATLAKWMVGVCDQFYAGKPGDDATVVAVTVREPRTATVAVGPPKDPTDDCRMVERLMGERGLKVVCGGTTGKIVARETGAQLEVDLKSMQRGIPPTARLHGIDLITEGIITLSKTLERLSTPDEIHGDDGVSRLARVLLDADHVVFLVGRAVNPAHQNPKLPISTTLKEQVLKDIVRFLQENGKETQMAYF
ncbi:MAG: SpoIIE family protein phosphatase [Clostridia bacterium]|nr:SpoIIE family protein phosphatase [Clostridia bacterium]